MDFCSNPTQTELILHYLYISTNTLFDSPAIHVATSPSSSFSPVKLSFSLSNLYLLSYYIHLSPPTALFSPYDIKISPISFSLPLSLVLPNSLFLSLKSTMSCVEEANTSKSDPAASTRDPGRGCSRHHREELKSRSRSHDDRGDQWHWNIEQLGFVVDDL